MRAVARPLSLVPVLAALAVWHPLVHDYFYADDFLHLLDLVTLPVSRFLVQIWAGHLYIVRNAVFLGMFEAFGPEPGPWFVSVLVTHLLNVLLLQRVISRLTGDPVVAGFGALLWGTSPVLEGALGWYAVYGQVLLSTLVLLVLSGLAETIAAGRTLSVRRALAWGLLLAAGGASFGIGLGIAAVFPLVAVIALPGAQRSARAVGTLAGAAAAILAVYAVIRIQDEPIESSAGVFLQPGALFAGLPEAIMFGARMLAFGMYTLLVGFVRAEAGSPGGPGMLSAAVVLGIVVSGWLAASAGSRRVQLAVGLLTLVAYGTTAVGRAPVVGFLKVSLSVAAAWARYHYLALALLTIVLCVALAALAARGGVARGTVYGAMLLWAVVRLIFVATRPLTIDLHANERAETQSALRSIREAVAATPPGDVTAIQNQPFHAVVVEWLFPGWAGLFVIHFPDNVVDGRQVRFLVSERDWALAQKRGGRIAALVERRPS